MDKDIFYNNLHLKLSQTYLITPSQVGFIRSYYFNNNHSFIGLLDHLLLKSKQPYYASKKSRTTTRRHSRKYFFELIMFVSGVSQKTLNDLVKEVYTG